MSISIKIIKKNEGYDWHCTNKSYNIDIVELQEEKTRKLFFEWRYVYETGNEETFFAVVGIGYGICIIAGWYHNDNCWSGKF